LTSAHHNRAAMFRTSRFGRTEVEALIEASKPAPAPVAVPGHSYANKCEFILADYYLLECLLVRTGKLDPTAL
jgi:hypothetical protein